MFGAAVVEPCSPKKGKRFDKCGCQYGEESTHLDNCLQALHIGPFSLQQPLGNKFSPFVLKKWQMD